MTPDDPQPAAPDEAGPPAEKGQRSGEGAATAWQAMIRKRKQVESPDDPAPPDPRPPLP